MPHHRLFVLGVVIASTGVVALITSVALEIVQQEPIWLLTAKISAGIFGLGGVIMGTLSVKNRGRK